MAVIKSRAQFAREVVHNAIAAHGGTVGVAKLATSVLRGDGILFRNGERLRFALEYSQELPQKSRTRIAYESGAEIVEVVNGEHVWQRVDGVETAVDGEAFEKAQTGLYASRVMSLAPLLDSSLFALEYLGESKLRGTPTLYVSVRSLGQKPINLCFGKYSGLLVGVSRPDQIEVFQNFCQVDGVTQARTRTIFRNAAKLLEITFTDFSYPTSFDAQTFSFAE